MRLSSLVLTKVVGVPCDSENLRWFIVSIKFYKVILSTLSSAVVSYHLCDYSNGPLGLSHCLEMSCFYINCCFTGLKELQLLVFL